MRTCRAARSTSEYTATAPMPISWHARMMRTAISPRFAIRIFLNIGDYCTFKLESGRGGIQLGKAVGTAAFPREYWYETAPLVSDGSTQRVPLIDFGGPEFKLLVL